MNKLAILLLSALPVLSQTRYVIDTVAGNVGLGDNGPALQALLFSPTSIAFDKLGNMYIADTFNNRIRRVAGGFMFTVACSGIAGSSGDHGPAIDAQCSGPGGVAVDASGNVYFSDTGNNTIRKVTSDGTINLVAGNGSPGYRGDNGPATSASLNEPSGLVFDASGNLYLADDFNHVIRRITPDGTISTVAGTHTCGNSGDGGLAIQAQLCNPLAVAVDPQGRILIADAANSRIRRFTPGGVISTVAGDVPGFGGDLGPAPSSLLNVPRSVAVDSRGNIYISDSQNSRIRMVTADGTITTLAGFTPGFSGDGGAAVNAMIDFPIGVAVDSAGNIYFADGENHRIRMISASTRNISTVAGYGHSAGDNGPAVSAVLGQPEYVAFDSAGNLYISDTQNHKVRKVDTSGRISTVVGTGVPGNMGDGGPAIGAQLNFPQGLAFDASGNLYIADSENNSIRVVSPGGQIRRLAGGGATLGDGGSAFSASLNEPRGLAFDTKGNLYVADTNNHRVRVINPAGTISTLIGDGKAAVSGDGGLASAAEIRYPWDVKVGNDGTVYFSQLDDSRVRSVSPAGIVGTIGFFTPYVRGLAIDPLTGKVLVSAAGQIMLQNSQSSGIAIAGVRGGVGFSGDGGPALQANIWAPAGITTDTKGNVYVADLGNNRIRKLTADTVSKVVIVSGDKQTGSAGATLQQPLIVQVNGISGAPFPGVTVRYNIETGGGRLSTISTVTGNDGRAGVTLTLPATAGAVTVSATVTGINPVNFSATAVAAPSSIAILGGNNQSAATGTQLPQILAVLVQAADRSAMPNVTVTFAVASGDATIDPASTQTAFDGTAYTRLTFGSNAGAVSVTATVAGLAAVTFNATATAANGPQISPGGIIGAGLSSPTVQSVSPNGIASIFGKNFAPDGTLLKVSGATLVDGKIATVLSGVCVTFGAVRAPVFLVTPGQLNVQVPQLAQPGAVEVRVTTACDTAAPTTSLPMLVSYQSATPEMFYTAVPADGKYPIAATDAVTGAGVGDPARLGVGFALARPGRTITIYATGFGLTQPAFGSGELPPAGAPVPSFLISIDGQTQPSASVLYAGVAPLNAGLYQVNLVLPASLTPGDHAIVITVGNSRSPTGYLSVGN